MMPVELFDTHCHLTSPELLPHLDRVMADAARAGVTRLITIASSVQELDAAMDVRRRYPQVHVAAGIHPHNAAQAGDGDLARMAEAWRDATAVAAGEIGLDYHYTFSPRLVQQTVFRRQLELAAETDLPLVIHCREAHEDAVKMLLETGYANRRVVFHCFSGTPQEAAELRSHGWRASFTGLITFQNAGAPRQAFVHTPLDQLMFETDAPYLSPEPVRKMRPNEPQNVAHTIRFAASLRKMPYERLAEVSTASGLAFFRRAGGA